MTMVLAHGPASESWVSHCAFRNLSLITSTSWDAQSGFPVGSLGDTKVEGSGKHTPILLQQGSSVVFPIGCCRLNFL